MALQSGVGIPADGRLKRDVASRAQWIQQPHCLDPQWVPASQEAPAVRRPVQGRGAIPCLPADPLATRPASDAEPPLSPAVCEAAVQATPAVDQDLPATNQSRWAPLAGPALRGDQLIQAPDFREPSVEDSPGAAEQGVLAPVFRFRPEHLKLQAARSEDRDQEQPVVQEPARAEWRLLQQVVILWVVVMELVEAVWEALEEQHSGEHPPACQAFVRAVARALHDLVPRFEGHSAEAVSDVGHRQPRVHQHWLRRRRSQPWCEETFQESAMS